MEYFEWFETYKPKKNHLNRNHDTEMFETYDIELGYVLATADLEPNRVWTLIEGDVGLWIVNGYHLVNRLGYYITEKPFEGDFIEILDTLFEEDEEEV